MTFAPCLVVPVFNHGPEIAEFLPELHRHGLPVILVDDGSGPETVAILDAIAAAEPDITMLRHKRNGGKGAAVASGLREAARRGFSHALQIDADGQHDPGDIQALLQAAKRSPDALIAGRPQYDASAPKGRIAARYLTHVWVWVETLSLQTPDSMCGFRVYPLAETVPLLDTTGLGRRMDFDPEIMVRLAWRGVEIIPVPTRVRYHQGGLSNFLMVTDNLLISWMHTRLVAGMLVRLPWLVWRKRGRQGKAVDG